MPHQVRLTRKSKTKKNSVLKLWKYFSKIRKSKRQKFSPITRLPYWSYSILALLTCHCVTICTKYLWFNNYIGICIIMLLFSNYPMRFNKDYWLPYIRFWNMYFRKCYLISWIFWTKNVSKIIQIIQNKGFSIYRHEPLSIFDTVVQG